MTELIRFQKQPDFPLEDINEQNAAMAEIYLATRTESEAYTEIHHDTLRVLHNVTNTTLANVGLQPANNRGEFTAFCHGYTMVDYLAVLINSRPFETLQNGASMNQLFLYYDDTFPEVLTEEEEKERDALGNMADHMIAIRLAERREMWLETTPISWRSCVPLVTSAAKPTNSFLRVLWVRKLLANFCMPNHLSQSPRHLTSRYAAAIATSSISNTKSLFGGMFAAARTEP